MKFKSQIFGLFATLTLFTLPAHADSTGLVTVTGNLDASTAATSVVPVSPPSFAALNAASDFNAVVQITDTLNASHDVSLYFFHTASNTWQIQGYVDGAEVGGVAGVPSAIFAAPLSMAFSNAGVGPIPPVSDTSANIPWTNGAAAGVINFSFTPFTQFASPSNISGITRECLVNCSPKGGLDFDGDNKDDFAIYRPAIGYWAVLQSSNNFDPANIIWKQWGLPGDFPMPGDYDGDKKTDLVVWRPSSGNWYTCKSSTGYDCTIGTVQQWGLPGDRPIKGDFDGDGKFDLTVWRPSNGSFYSKSSFDNTLIQKQWGFSTDIPLGDSPAQ